MIHPQQKDIAKQKGRYPNGTYLVPDRKLQLVA